VKLSRTMVVKGNVQSDRPLWSLAERPRSAQETYEYPPATDPAGNQTHCRLYVPLR
jgi:hypothetical protein